MDVRAAQQIVFTIKVEPLSNEFSGATCKMSHVMRKPVYAICEQHWRRSACASAQSDSAFVVRCRDSIIVSISEISSLKLASVAVQAGLSLNWSQTQKTGFLVTRLIWPLLYFSMMQSEKLKHDIFPIDCNTK